MELATQTPDQTVPTAVAHTAPDQSLATWAKSVQEVWTVAKVLSSTTFVPEAFRGSPGDTCAAIIAGHEMGITPIASLSAFHVIKKAGVAAPYARTLHAVALKAGHEIQITESTDTKVTGRARRAGTDTWTTCTWDLERAHTAGLTSKDNWKHHPQAMMRARVLADLVRMVAPDVALGIATAEELNAPTQDTQGPPKPATTTVKRRKRKTEPQPNEEPTPDTPEIHENQLTITDNQTTEAPA